MARPLSFSVFAALLTLIANAASLANDPLPGTKVLTETRPLDEVMVDGIDRFCLREIKAARDNREQHWNRDFSSVEAYQKSIAGNRERFREYIGAVDPRVTAASPNTFSFETLDSIERSSVVARSNDVTVYAVRWQVLDGVTAEGLLLRPEGINAAVVALPDADWTPEDFAGLSGNLPALARLPWRLAAEAAGKTVACFTRHGTAQDGAELRAQLVAGQPAAAPCAMACVPASGGCHAGAGRAGIAMADRPDKGVPGGLGEHFSFALRCADLSEPAVCAGAASAGAGAVESSADPGVAGLVGR